MLLSVIGWVLIGLIAAALATRSSTSRGMGLPLNITFGLLGAMVGGGIFSNAGANSVLGFHLPSLFGAAVGATAVLGVIYALRGAPVKPGARRQ